jgi:dTDP-4-dehydrorhamnose reductase
MGADGRLCERWWVLGASGFLGVHLVEVLAAQGHEVLGERVELGDPRTVPAALDRWQPERVVLAAALSRIDACARDPERARRVNGEAPGAVARWCSARGARLLFVSTDQVFGAVAPGPRGFGEQDPPAPLTVYGASKAAGERAVLAADPRALVVRLPLLFGDSRGRGLGATDSLVDALGAGRPVTLFEDEWRTPLEVRAAAEALVELAGGQAPGLLHLAGAERVTRFELGRRALLALGRGELPAPRAGTRAAAGLDAERARDTALDSTRARALLRHPLPDLTAGLVRWAAVRRSTWASAKPSARGPERTVP